MKDSPEKLQFSAVGASRVYCVLFCLVVFVQGSICSQQIERLHNEDSLGLTPINDETTLKHKSKRSTKPIIVVPPMSSTVTQGGTALFYCKATVGKVTWTKLKSSLPAQRSSVYQLPGSLWLLMINNIIKSDQGKYQCTATNGQGTATAVATLTVKGRPVKTKLHKSPRSTITQEGRNVTFTCEAEGFPAPVITWSRALSTPRSPVIHSQSKKRDARYEIVSSTMTLSNVTESDSGLYVCNATNNVNSVTGVAPLIVTSVLPFKFVTKLPPTRKAVEGDKVVLHCQALNADSIHWTSSRRSALGRSTKYSNGTIVIPGVKPQDGGIYTCKGRRKVFGLVQTISTSTLLTVIESSRGLERSTILSKFPAVYRQVLTGYLSSVVRKSRRWVRCWTLGDGADARRYFHKQCDNKGPTVTIVQYRNFVFGGYTDISWKRRNDHAGAGQSKSFLFSLSNIDGFNPIKMVLRGYDNYKAIYDGNVFYPSFGEGFDLKMIRAHVAMWPQTYIRPPGCEYEKYCKFYTGRERFTLHDIEVFYEN